MKYKIERGALIEAGFGVTVCRTNRSWPFKHMRPGDSTVIPNTDWPAARNALTTYRNAHKDVEFYVSPLASAMRVHCIKIAPEPSTPIKRAKRIRWPFSSMEAGDVVQIPTEDFERARAAAYCITYTKGFQFDCERGNVLCTFRRTE